MSASIAQTRTSTSMGVSTLSRFILSCSLIVAATPLIEAFNSCSLYLAETLDDHGRLTMGVFTAVDISEGTIIGFPDAVVPLIDIPIHNTPNPDDEQDFWWMFEDLVWDVVDVGGAGEGIDVKSAALGLGSMVRGDSKKYNVMPSIAEHDSAGLHRSKDPGAGAFSNYHAYPVYAMHDIKAGQELYFPHGYHWNVEHDEQQDTLDFHPAEYPKVKAFFKKYQDMESKYGSDVLTPEFRNKLWGIVRESPLDEPLDKILPPTWEDARSLAHHVLNRGSDSVAWLAENGVCLDNMQTKTSTIPQAGRGAFATRSMAEGSIITSAPVVHIVDKDYLNMYRPAIDVDGDFVVTNTVYHSQLLLNYCFGHKESTKLLCPIGASTGVINHSPTPNAAIRWAENDLAFHHSKWFNMSVEELGEETNIGLMLEYVALREIKEGEEIFINYGAEWEEAWKQHVENWTPAPGSEDYISAAEMNDREEVILRTEMEQLTQPYPSNLIMTCEYEYFENEDTDPELAHEFEDFFAADSIFQGEHLEAKLWFDVSEPEETPQNVFSRPCRILRRTRDYNEDGEEEYFYDVHMMNDYHMQEDQVIDDDVMLIVKDVPRGAMFFRDMMYSTDAHLENAFRHEMMLPDALFPQAWRNIPLKQ